MRYLPLLLCMLSASCEPLTGPLPLFAKGDAIPCVAFSTVGVVSPPKEPKIVQDNSHLVVVSASAPVSSFTIVRARVTAYCPCSRCTPGLGKTSTGKSAWKPGIAADPCWLAYGTLVEVDGYGIEPVDDTGKAMKRRYWVSNTPRLDVRMKYHWEAREFGVQYLDVKIYKR